MAPAPGQHVVIVLCAGFLSLISEFEIFENIYIIVGTMLFLFSQGEDYLP